MWDYRVIRLLGSYHERELTLVHLGSLDWELVNLVVEPALKKTMAGGLVEQTRIVAYLKRRRPQVEGATP